MKHSTCTGTVILAILLLTLTASVATAAVTLDVSTNYDGIDGDDQSVTANMTLSPEGAEMTDVVIDIRETERAFIDFDSFERSVTPGDASINITYQGAGRFTVENLRPSETLTIQFDAYPRSIQSETVDVATIDVQYVQNGQDLEEEQIVSADISNSPWFEYQAAQQTAENRFRIMIGGIVVGVVGIVIGAWAVIKLRSTDGAGGTGGGGGDGEF